MNNKAIVGGLVAMALIGGGAFYGGMVYAKSSIGARGQFAGAGGGVRAGRTGMGGFTAGQILSKDATSITIKMQDGSTKIVLVGSSTQVMKTAAGSLADLAVGANVTVSGSANSDGSLTAQSVQIRPAGSMPLGGGQRLQATQ